MRKRTFHKSQKSFPKVVLPSQEKSATILFAFAKAVEIMLIMPAKIVSLAKNLTSAWFANEVLTEQKGSGTAKTALSAMITAKTLYLRSVYALTKRLLYVTAAVTVLTALLRKNTITQTGLTKCIAYFYLNLDLDFLLTKPTYRLSMKLSHLLLKKDNPCIIFVQRMLTD